MKLDTTGFFRHSSMTQAKSLLRFISDGGAETLRAASDRLFSVGDNDNVKFSGINFIMTKSLGKNFWRINAFRYSIIMGAGIA